MPQVVMNGLVLLWAEEGNLKELCQGSKEQCQLTEHKGIEVQAQLLANDLKKQNKNHPPKPCNIFHVKKHR